MSSQEQTLEESIYTIMPGESMPHWSRKTIEPDREIYIKESNSNRTDIAEYD